MYQLPQDLISHIAAFVEREDDQSQVPRAHRVQNPSKLPPYATISRTWQIAIEQLTFREIWLKSTELSYFLDTVVGHRRPVLAVLQYEIILPTYDDAKCAKFESDSDKHLNNQVFTDGIHGLFRVLKSWEDTVEGSLLSVYAISLNLYSPYSPMDGIHRGKEKYKDDKWQSDLGQRHDIWDHRYEHSVLRLFNTQDLPKVSSISQFSGYLHYPRSIEPYSIAAIAARLVNLRCVNWTLKDNEKKDAKMQKDDRNNFAKALSTLAQPTMKTFHLSFYNESPSNQSFLWHGSPRPVLVFQDDLSLALHKFSQSTSIEEIELEGPIVISPSLFWPSNPKTTPFWPNLTSFHVSFNLTTLDGEWYFVRDPDVSVEESVVEEDVDDENESDDSDDSEFSLLSDDSLAPDTFNERKEARAAGDLPFRYFRTKPDDEKINPLLTAMARAADRMPKLQRMFLKADLFCNSVYAYFEVEYLAPGETSWNCPDKEDGDEEKPRLYWHVGRWRPEDEVLRLWREAKGVNGEILVMFVEW